MTLVTLKAKWFTRSNSTASQQFTAPCTNPSSPGPEPQAWWGCTESLWVYTAALWPGRWCGAGHSGPDSAGLLPSQLNIKPKTKLDPSRLRGTAFQRVRLPATQHNLAGSEDRTLYLCMRQHGSTSTLRAQAPQHRLK